MDRPPLKSYMALIAKKAWATWRKLPPQHKSWIDVDDLIQDGILFARFQALPRYRPQYGKFTTYLYVALDNYYKNMLAEYFTSKRNKCRLVPVCSVLHRLTDEDVTEDELRAVRGLMLIIREASPVLRRYLHHWLFVRGHVHLRGEQFAIARSELLALSKKCGFGRDDFEYLLRSEGWRRGLQPIQQKFLTTERSSRPIL